MEGRTECQQGENVHSHVGSDGSGTALRIKRLESNCNFNPLDAPFKVFPPLVVFSLSFCLPVKDTQCGGDAVGNARGVLCFQLVFLECPFGTSPKCLESAAMSIAHYRLPRCVFAISGCKIRSDSKRKDYVHVELLYLYPETDNQIFYLLFSFQN